MGYFCDDCGVEATSRDGRCRNCGSPLIRPSRLWRLQLAIWPPLPPSKPAAVELSTSKASSIPSSSIEEVEESESEPLWSPEPQEGGVSLTPESWMVENDRNKRVVLEKASITNRKSPTQSMADRLQEVQTHLDQSRNQASHCA